MKKWMQLRLMGPGKGSWCLLLALVFTGNACSSYRVPLSDAIPSAERAALLQNVGGRSDLAATRKVSRDSAHLILGSPAIQKARTVVRSSESLFVFEGLSRPLADAITRDDIEQLIRDSIDYLEVVQFAGVARVDRQPNDEIFEKYIAAFVRGKFVTRRGVVLSQPRISSAGINNATVTAFIQVLVEAALDQITEVPCYADARQTLRWLNSGGRQPTFLIATGSAGVRFTTDASVDGVSLEEVEMMNYLASSAASRADILSDTIARRLSNVEISFVLGSDFAVGDDETLVSVTNMFVDAMVYRLVLHGAYSHYRNHDLTPAQKQLCDFLRLVDQITD